MLESNNDWHLLILSYHYEVWENRSQRLYFLTFHWWMYRGNLYIWLQVSLLFPSAKEKASPFFFTIAEPKVVPCTGRQPEALRPRKGNCNLSGFPNLPIMIMEIAGLITGLARLCWLPMVFPKDILSQLDPDKWLGIHRLACQEATSAFGCKHCGVLFGSNTDTCFQSSLVGLLLLSTIHGESSIAARGQMSWEAWSKRRGSELHSCLHKNGRC